MRIPTLMLNGRYDFDLPWESEQKPLFALLGSPAADKRHVVLETGHALPIAEVAREILPWLDRYLGPLSPSPPLTTRLPPGARLDHFSASASAARASNRVESRVGSGDSSARTSRGISVQARATASQPRSARRAITPL